MGLRVVMRVGQLVLVMYKGQDGGAIYSKCRQCEGCM